MKTPLGSDFESRNETSEIAAGVDAAENTEYGAGILGTSVWFGQSIPHSIGTQSTGGGYVQATNQGIEYSAGSTSGDDAQVQLSWQGGVQECEKVKVSTTFRTANFTPPATDDVRVGMGNSYLDLLNEQYVVGNTTAAATTNDRGVLEIVTDFENGETTFRQPVIGEEVTINAVEYPRATWFLATSNGGGDVMQIYNAREVIIP